MKKTITILYFALSVLLLFSCDRDKFDVFAPDELGMPDHEFYAEKTGGNIYISYLANKAGTISLQNASDGSWVQLGATSFDADGSLSLTISPNSGIARRADILFSTDTRRDTVSVFQRGAVEELFYFASNSIMVYNEPGNSTVNEIKTDISVDIPNVKTEIRYIGSNNGWIDNLKLSSKSLTFNTSSNPDNKSLRRAVITLSFVDGWRHTQTEKITVTQARADNEIGTKYTPEELRNAALPEGFNLPDDAYVEGYIVSTTEGGNAGDVIVDDFSGTGTIDYTLTARTSYLESLDGRYGFKLITPTEEDNSFRRYSRVKLNLGGCVIWKTSDTPVMYTIEDVSSDNILVSDDGTGSIPVKEKSIAELTDDDINTLVTIKDCEIAMRKGPFTPVNEGYGKACSYNRLGKFPILIRDINGGSMYMFTNMTCTYRRNGDRLPYGSGNITGIIVHESYESFEKDGDIGPYQLRHLTREEIDLKPDFKDNFSGIITEFRYAKFPSDWDVTKLTNPILATKGNGELCHTGGTIGNFAKSFFYIGECGSKKKGKYAEGAGIELDEGGIYEPWIGRESKQNTDGKGWYENGLLLSWSSKKWWDSTNNRGYCWLINFSTKGISSDKVSMQFAMYNNSSSAQSPRYWKAQYSLTTTETSAANDSAWKDIAEFTVPDVGIWGSSGEMQNQWQTLGTRVYDFPLPKEILGRESVSIRLMPRNNKAAKYDVTSYDNGTIKNDKGYNTMDYFAVRYNK